MKNTLEADNKSKQIEDNLSKTNQWKVITTSWVKEKRRTYSKMTESEENRLQRMGLSKLGKKDSFIDHEEEWEDKKEPVSYTHLTLPTTPYV